MPPSNAGIDTVSPLDDAGTLLHMLNILGPGQHLFISTVSKAWQEVYEGVDCARVTLPLQYSYRLPPHPCFVISAVTSYSAVFTSVSRVILAHKHGLAFNRNEKLEHVAGLVADVPALRAARELGLALTDRVLIGAALSGSVLKLQWY
jgi:hypothetical protein